MAIAASILAITSSCKDKFGTDKADKPGDIIHPSSISLEEEDVYLTFGSVETIQLIVKLLPDNATDKRVEWSSSKESVATVSNTGLVTAVGSGNCTITVKPVDWDGEMSAECWVEVKPKTPEAVDLGLSVKWADMNIGADKVGDPGFYFPWGYVTPGTTGRQDTYIYQKGKSDPPSELSGNDHDAAVRYWGSPWRMPTNSEMLQLIENCTWEEETIGSMKVYKVSRNGKSIFLPFGGAATTEIVSLNQNGYYWSSTLGAYPGDISSEKWAKGMRLRLTSDRNPVCEKWDGWVGQSIRPVQP